MEKTDQEPLSQEDFDRYIRRLPYGDDCMYMIGIELYLCGNEKFDCVYRDKETFSLKSGKRKECKRQKVLQIKRVLGK